MAIKLILADLDGTLLDSMPCWVSLPYDTLRQNDMPVPEDLPELIRTMPMWRIAGVFAQRYPHFRDEEALYSEWMETMRGHYAQTVQMKPGALSFLQAMKKQGIRVCLLTATAMSLLKTPLERFSLSELLSAVITEADTGSSKSTGIPYIKCMERFGTRPEETLLLEDSCTNLRAGAKLGMPLAGVYDPSMEALWPEICDITAMQVTCEEDWLVLAEKIKEIE